MGQFGAMADGEKPALRSCLFCEMARGEIKPHVIFEDTDLMAFLDIGPIRRGHTQIIPREHIECFDDLLEPLLTKIVALGQRIATAQKGLYGVERVAFLFTGGDIPHVHAHVVPMQESTDITSRRYIQEETLTFTPIPDTPKQELEEVASAMRRALRSVP